MRTHTALARSTRLTTDAWTVYRTTAAPAATLAVALLTGGCDRPTPAEAAPSAARSTPASSSSGAASTSMRLVDPPDAVSARPGDAAGVAAVAAAWDAAWNAGDGGAIGALFVEDAEFVNGRGQVAVGAAAIGAQHAANLAGPFRGSHIRGTIRRITFLSGTTAVLDVDSELTGFVSLPPGTVATEPGVQRGRHKRVLVKRAGRWRIQLMQITTVAPTPSAG